MKYTKNISEKGQDVISFSQHVSHGNCKSYERRAINNIGT